MNNVAHLYKITNTVTGEYYIGKHNGWTQKDYNGKTYWGSGKRIKSQVKKYGYQNFKYDILVISNSKYIFDLEKKIVTQELIEGDVNCLNLDIGGEGSHFFSEEIRKKMKENRKPIIPWNKGKKGLQVGWRKGTTISEETKQKIVESNRGQKRSEETKRKLVESHLGKTPSNKGVPMGKEQLEKITAWAKEYWKDKPGFMTGKTHDDETKAKMKLAWEKRKEEKKGLTIGYTFINNGTINKFVPPELLQEHIESGWLKGMMRRNKF
jgi:hypothetical protein